MRWPDDRLSLDFWRRRKLKLGRRALLWSAVPLDDAAAAAAGCWTWGRAVSSGEADGVLTVVGLGERVGVVLLMVVAAASRYLVAMDPFRARIKLERQRRGFQGDEEGVRDSRPWVAGGCACSMKWWEGGEIEGGALLELLRTLASRSISSRRGWAGWSAITSSPTLQLREC